MQKLSINSTIDKYVHRSVIILDHLLFFNGFLSQIIQNPKVSAVAVNQESGEYNSRGHIHYLSTPLL